MTREDSHELAAEELGEEVREKLRPMLEKLSFDDEPVKRGYWREWNDEVVARKGGFRKIRYYSCSKCEGCNAVQSNYCPRCGAKMDQYAVGV